MEEVHEAIQNRDTKTLKNLIKNIDVNQQDSKLGYSYMITAIESNNVPAAKLLFENGYNANLEYNKLPDFYLTIVENNFAIAKLFIDNGFDTKKYGNLMLDYCLIVNNIKIMKLLFDNGAKFDSENIVKYFEKINPETLELLLEHGFDIDTQDVLGDTLLIIASRNSNTKLVRKILVKGANPNIQNKYLSTALHFANYSIAKILLEFGADWKIKDINDKTILDYAREEKNKKLISLFI